MTISRTHIRGVGFLSFALLLTSAASADTFGTYGDVSVVTGPDSNPAYQLTSNTAGVGYAGIYVQFSAATALSTITTLSAQYDMTTGTFGGGAPRFSIIDTTNNALNEAYVYWGTPQAGGTFTDPNSGNSTYASTGNLASTASPQLYVQVNGFGGDSTGASYETWNQFVAKDGATDVGYITIDLDGGFTGTQVMDVTKFDVNGTIYSPPASSSAPEPGTAGLLSLAIAGAGIGVRTLRRRK